MENQHKILEQLLGIDLNINFSIFKNINFSDVYLEEKFNNVADNKNKNKKVFYNLIIVGSYIASFLNLVKARRRYFYFILIFVFLFINIFVMICASLLTNKKFKMILDYLSIFFLSLYLNIKAINLSYDQQISLSHLDEFSFERQEANIVILIRAVLYNIIITNLLLFFKINSNICIHFIYSILNLCTIIYCQIKLPKDTDYILFLDGIFSIVISMIFFIYRKLWEFKIREVFVEKYKFENLFLYAKDFILGLNSFHLNFKNNYLLCYDEKFYKFLNKNLQASHNKTSSQIFAYTKTFSKMKNKTSFSNKDKFFKELKNTDSKSNACSNYNEIKQENFFNDYLKNFDLKQLNPMTYFLKELKKYENDQTKFLKIISNTCDKNLIVNNVHSNSFKNFYDSDKNVCDINDKNNYNYNKIGNFNDLDIKVFNYEHKSSINEKEETQNNNVFDIIQDLLKNMNKSDKKLENVYLGIFSFESEKNKLENFEFLIKSKQRKSIKKDNQILKKIKRNRSLQTKNENKTFFFMDNSNLNFLNKSDLSENDNLDIINIDVGNVNKKKSSSNMNPYKIDFTKDEACFPLDFPIAIAEKVIKDSNNKEPENMKNFNNKKIYYQRNKCLKNESDSPNKNSNLYNKCFNNINNNNNININVMNINPLCNRKNSKFSNISSIDENDKIKWEEIRKYDIGNSKEFIFKSNKELESEVNYVIENQDDNKINFRKYNHITFKNLENPNFLNEDKFINKYNSNQTLKNSNNDNHSKNDSNKCKFNHKISFERNFSNKISSSKNINSQDLIPKTKEDLDLSDTLYFEVYFRRIYFSDDNIIYNLILYDVSDLIHSKLKILDENKKKQKVFAKIAHEFKTPLTSIISLISILKDDIELELENNIDEEIQHYKGSKTNNKIKNPKANNKKDILNEDTCKTLDIIQNLSRFVIFLTSDIINYSDPENMNQLKLDINKVDFKEMSIFCYDILRSLLYCNHEKFKKIKTKLIYDESLDILNYFSDQVRLKQILLNFISNSVKFTNEGFINLIFKKCSDNDKLILTVKDSGIGIKNEDKNFLFKEYFKNEDVKLNNLNNANIGSGLGLAICKNMADRLNIKINIDSEYSKGSAISLIIDLNTKENNFKGENININPSFSNSNNLKNHNLTTPKINEYYIANLENNFFSNSSNLSSLFKDKGSNTAKNHKFNISYLESYFDKFEYNNGMENNNFDTLSKKEVLNRHNKVKSERFFRNNKFETLSSYGTNNKIAKYKTDNKFIRVKFLILFF